MTFVTGLQCRECGQSYPQEPLHVCDTCFGPLEIQYDYERIKKSISRATIAAREHNLWRYRELLPIDGEPRIGLYSGFTPLVRAHRLGAVLGVEQLYIKDDSVNHPTFSYKDRVVSVAISKAVEFGFETVSCASTGNLANSVAAHAARAGLDCYVFIPEGLEQGKIIGSSIYGPKTVAIKGNYDDVNRLAPKSATNTAGLSSTSTCARIIPKGQRLMRSKLRSNSVGSCLSTSSSRQPAARFCPNSPKASKSSLRSASSKIPGAKSILRRRTAVLRLLTRFIRAPIS